MNYRDPATLPTGTIILSFGEKSPDGYPWWKKLILTKLGYPAIRKYQSRKYPGGRDLGSVHVVLHLGSGIYLDVTYPKAKVHRLYLNPDRQYTAYTWTGASSLTPNAIGNMQAAAYAYDGKRYDTLQLIGLGAIAVLQEVVGMLIRRYVPAPVTGWVEGTINKVLSFQVPGLGKAYAVCSTGAHTALRAAYRILKLDRITVDKPLGDQWVESTCPADFANHPSFTPVELTV